MVAGLRIFENLKQKTKAYFSFNREEEGHVGFCMFKIGVEANRENQMDGRKRKLDQKKTKKIVET